MKSYIPNNINFRIVSSNAIAKFKQDQAYDFNEINQHKNDFSSQAREVILLEYDHWFKWIVKLEKVFLMLSEDDDSDLLYQKTNILLHNEMDDISEIMSVYTDYFSAELTSFMKFVHRYSLDTLTIALQISLKENDMFSSYSKIVFLLSLYLQQILLALQEIEYVIHKNPEIGKLFYSDWCKETCKISSGCPLATRAKFFKDKFGLSKFMIVNHTNTEFSGNCKDKFTEVGVEVILTENS